MEFLPYILFGIGLLFIIKGGDYFVEAATWMAKTTGLPEVLIGATVVSLATTFPELMVSVLAASKNYPSMALGNAVGSTICNTALILGLYHLIRPSRLSTRIFNVKGLLMLSYMLILWLLTFTGRLGRLASALLLGMLVVYALLNVLIMAYKTGQVPLRQRKMNRPDRKIVINQILTFAFGIALILAGARLLVANGVRIAEFWGVPKAVISLTLIAFGTSLPELVTSLTALMKGHGALSIGNILGSNILNVTMVIGFSALTRPLPVAAQMIRLDLPAALLLNGLLVIPGMLNKRITRLQSVLLLAGYFIYMGVLFI